MVRAADSLAAAKQLHQSCYDGLWTTQAPVFEAPGSGCFERIDQLLQGLEKITDRSNQFDCAKRLGLMFVAHDVEQIMKLDNLGLSTGRGRKTAAFKKIAEETSWAVDKVGGFYKRSKNYMALITLGGPGTLLELGTGLNSL